SQIGHLSFEQMAGLVDGELAEPDGEVFNAHIAYCRQCGEEVRDLVQEKVAISGRHRAYTPGSPRVVEPQTPIVAQQPSAYMHLGIRERLSGVWSATVFRWAIQVAAAAVIVLLAVWWVDLRLGSRIASLQSRLAELEQEKQTLERRQ